MFLRVLSSLSLFSLMIVVAGFSAPCVLAQTTASEKSSPAKYPSFKEARTAGREFRNAGKFEQSRDAYEAALDFDSSNRDRNEVLRALIYVYPELGEWEKTYEVAEQIVENPPAPAFASLALSSMVGIATRKNMGDALLQRYQARLEESPKDRTTLIILERAVTMLRHDMPRRADLLQRLIALDKADGKPLDFDRVAKLAFTLRLADKEVESAEMYQDLAEQVPSKRSSCLAEAAESWQRAGEPDKAISLAIEASNLGPDAKPYRDLYHWNRMLADLFLKHLAKAPALKHYTAARQTAKIDAYREQCDEKLKLVQALKD
ncbi:hypothetical protein LF1_26100 [Rubripirellula obstinata]|uniref:Tetratricopeptide repeat protein n=1 Tax=Rubripirellula obstinata TaxID=406547 RepID=A0A5B1CII2_9BACT|nr:hypothetical protein [Rubripirellula obstinata]KAA1260071.1 hypothetical protein LF1_26100 [Rubripirellula obstinata]